ncbi:hypothetical protein D3C87_1731640 [compost metagenome]
MQQGEHFHQQRFPLHAARRRGIDQRHHAFAVRLDHGFHQRQRLIVVERAEHRADRDRRKLAVTAGNGLIGEA